MSQVTFKETPVKLAGTFPEVGSKAPDFQLTKNDLSELTLKELLGNKWIVLNIFPSLDTSTCATSVRKFNEAASALDNAIVLCISADLPFAQKRFCETEGLTNVIPASVFRHRDFGDHYGVLLKDGPLEGLLSRAVIILDPQGTIKYTQLVSEITKEPNYDAALQHLQG